MLTHTIFKTDGKREYKKFRLHIYAIKLYIYTKIGHFQPSDCIFIHNPTTGKQKKAEDYAERLEYMKTIGLSCSPHIVVGLDYGEIKGEYAALDIVYEFSPEKLVLVVLKPLSGTKMSRTSPPPLEDVLSFFESAVKKLPGSSFY